VPELPEVETIARGLSAALAGRTLGPVRAARSDYVSSPRPSADAHLEGRRVESVTRCGKRLSIRLCGGGEIVVHLGMSGRLGVVPAAEPPAPHTHLRVGLDDGARELRMTDPRRFGGIWIRAAGGSFARGARRHRARPGSLGPDALDLDLAALARLLARPRRIKALLLDQHAIAGLGNIYVDEILWAARIHPATLAASIPPRRVAVLHRALRRILRAAIESGGSTIRDYRGADGEEGRFQERHRVFRRTGKPCLRCGAAIRRLVVAGRGTHVCPRCQRTPRRRSAQRGGGPSRSSRSNADSSSTGTPISSALRRLEPASSPATTKLVARLTLAATRAPFARRSSAA
jgi:formamidopyrimidine-DNA glycosylase